MMQRRHGFSLVELSFVLVIIMILAGITAGGGSYLANEAKSRKMAELAKEMFSALNQRYAKTGNWPRPGDGDTANLEASLFPYLEGRSSGTSTQFQDPWLGTTKTMTAKDPSVSVLQATDYGNPAGLWTLGAPSAVRLVYYYQPSAPTNGLGTLRVIYDQDRSYSFRFFAVQALDVRGMAVATYVH